MVDNLDKVGQALQSNPQITLDKVTLAYGEDQPSVQPSLTTFLQVSTTTQRYEIKSPPWTILCFRILGIFSVENIARLGVFMFQTSDNSQLCIDSQYSSQ